MKKPAKISAKYAALIKQFNAIPLDDQPEVLSELANHHDYNRVTKLADLKSQILKLEGGAEIVARAKKQVATIMRQVRERAKPKPKYRSKKNKKLTWSGRGSVPRWMREEMKELKLKPETFLIKRGK